MCQLSGERDARQHGRLFCVAAQRRFGIRFGLARGADQIVTEIGEGLPAFLHPRALAAAHRAPHGFAPAARPITAPAAAEAQQREGGNSGFHCRPGYRAADPIGLVRGRESRYLQAFSTYASASRRTTDSVSPSVFRRMSPPRTKSSTST